MSTEWKTLRAELPEEVRARLDAKRQERRLGKALAELRTTAMQAAQQEVASGAGTAQNTGSKIARTIC